MVVERTPVQQPVHFPFGPDFQKTLLRLLCEDDSFAHALKPHLHPQYFENEVLAWAYAYCQRHVEQYGAMPSVRVLLEQTRTMDVRIRPLYTAVIQEVEVASLHDEVWLKDNVLDFVKRNIFARAFHESRELYNSGKTAECYDLMQTRMEELYRTTWEPVDRSFFFEELAQREMRRRREDPSEGSIPTGFPWLDNILQGGLSVGELGIWVAYPKIGKTTILANHGRYATRDAFLPVAHFVFEGSRQQVENRYDAAFMNEVYNKVKRGDCTHENYEAARRQYELLRGRLVIQGFTDRWDYNVADIDQALKDLRRAAGFVPKLVIVDYGDLLGGREKRYRNEYEKQRAAFRDLKSLANRGYAIWTASQAQRPEKDAETKPHLLKARQIAEAYEKVRVADFLGSLNQTLDEKRDKVMRLYAELYRDNAADQSLTVEADMAKMRICQKPNVASSSDPAAPKTPALGYVKPVQVAAPV
jgi:replicative DNA helicase